ncbi:hypothetical protein VE00_01034 [Pseudogymnoascus sp. WSF 3629]|nr:hypothetical protein VE00_01034 [Pseudogymnoascus sp. WSF 3629]
MTGLHLAAYFGVEIPVNVFHEIGLTAHLEDSYGQTPLFWAAGNGHEAIVLLLLEEGAKAAGNGHEAIVQLLVEEGAKLDTKDRLGWTLLSWAAGGEHEAVVQLLVEEGAKLDTKDSYG